MELWNLQPVKNQKDLNHIYESPEKVEDQYHTEGYSHNNGKPMTTEKKTVWGCS